MVESSDTSVTTETAALTPEFESWPTELLNARVVIWFCPVDHHHRVQWETDEAGMTPRCLEPGCGQVGATR
jgi:hypothetical protein